MSSNQHEGWLPLEDLPVPRRGECVHVQVLLSKEILGSRIHTARYSLTANDKIMCVIAGHFDYDFGEDTFPIRFKFLPEIPEGL